MSWLSQIIEDDEPRNCLVCGAHLRPYKHVRITAHEFNCYKAAPGFVPAELKEEFEKLLAWERRSANAKAAWRRRR